MFGKKDMEKRFEIVCEQSINLAGITVIRDIQTGVNYIVGQGTSGFAITPLIDRDGMILVTASEEN